METEQFNVRMGTVCKTIGDADVPALPRFAGRALVDDFFDRFGYPRPEQERLDYEALRDASMREQLGDCGCL